MHRTLGRFPIPLAELRYHSGAGNGRGEREDKIGQKEQEVDLVVMVVPNPVPFFCSFPAPFLVAVIISVQV